LLCNWRKRFQRLGERDTGAIGVSTATSAAPVGTKVRTQFFCCKFAILVFINLPECGYSILNFLGGDFTIPIGIKRGHDWKNAHDAAPAGLSKKRQGSSQPNHGDNGYAKVIS